MHNVRCRHVSSSSVLDDSFLPAHKHHLPVDDHGNKSRHSRLTRRSTKLLEFQQMKVINSNDSLLLVCCNAHKLFQVHFWLYYFVFFASLQISKE